MSVSEDSSFTDQDLLTVELSSDFEQDAESLTCDYEDLEPVATEEEAAAYRQERVQEEEQEEMLRDRLKGRSEISSWCKCTCCSLDAITKAEECFCCSEIDRCVEKLEAVADDGELPPICITLHPGSQSCCLDEWVLEIAAIGLRNRKNRRYTSMYEQGQTAKSQFLRSVSYRQFTRLVWEYMGCSKRLPLPCCAYNVIRKKFPSEDGQYKGFEEEDEEGQDTNENEKDDLERMTDDDSES